MHHPTQLDDMVQLPINDSYDGPLDPTHTRTLCTTMICLPCVRLDRFDSDHCEIVVQCHQVKKRAEIVSYHPSSVYRLVVLSSIIIVVMMVTIHEHRKCSIVSMNSRYVQSTPGNEGGTNEGRLNECLILT
jgi:hypothetical protein